MRTTLLLGAALIGMAVASSAQAAAPLLQMQLTSGAAATGVITEGAGGVVTFVGSLGVFTLNVTNGFGATAGLGKTIDLASFNATAAAGGTLTMMLTETNLTGVPITPTQFLSNISGQLGINSATLTSLSYTTYISAANTAFATTTLVGATQNFSAPSGGAAGTSFATTPAGGVTGSAVTGALFSETLVVTLTTGGSSRTSLDATMGPKAVPEPSSILPLAFGIGAITLIARRRKRDSEI